MLYGLSNVERKSFPVEVKAAGDSGQFTALAAVFGNVDRGGDRILPGAFTKVLDQMREAGDPLPIVLSHKHEDPMAVIGKADPTDVVETADGLQVTGNLDLSNPVAKQAHKLMKERLLKGWSFAYTVAKDGQKVNDGVNDITEMKDLFEAGPTLIGMNPEAQLQAVKSLESELETELQEPPKQSTTEIEDPPDEEPSPAKSRRQDPLADEIDDLWLATAAVTPGGSNEVAERAAPPRR